jgi:Cu+-exporting ATPase
MGVALAAAAGWFFVDPSKALRVFTSVLIVACPCALALSAPLTHGTAQRLLARWKIFLKNPLVLERMASVDTLVFDKTGTLTTAAAGGVEFQSVARETTNQDLSVDESRWVGSLARLSTHPHAVRITRAVSPAALPVTGFEEFPGAGIAGVVAGHRLLLGSVAWLEQRGIPVGGPLRTPAGSLVGVAIDGRLRGAFAVQNSLRPEVAELIARLGRRFELALLSGDNEREVARFQEIFGPTTTLKFHQSPADKLEFIRQLQGRGRRVLMVGDGLNDAGALRQADVGVAVVEQIGVFSPASDVILDAAQLPRLAEVLNFSRQSARVVRAGFVISGIYNVAGVSIAAAGWLAPIVCAILMPLSSATVVAFACLTTAWLGARAFHHCAPPREIPDAAGPVRTQTTALEAA